LNADFDHIARRRDVSLHRSRAERLLKNKKAYVFIARGGFYSGTADT
jgi:FMN-dependent NADH-azoreductase